MKILFVLEHFHPYTGGAEKLFKYLTTGLVDQGCQVEVITTRHSSKLPRFELMGGVKIYRVKAINRYLFTLASIPYIFKHGRSCDIIHTTSYNAALPVFLANIFLRKKTVITFHEVWGKLWFALPYISWPAKLAHYLFEQLILRLSFAKFVGVSAFTSSELLKYKKRKNNVATIYNGIDYSEFEGFKYSPPAEFTYCYFGRLGSSKGLDILLIAAKKIMFDIPGSKLKLIIPKVPRSMFNQIKKTIMQLGISDHLIILHDLDKQELYSELVKSTCVVIPSYSEGFGYAAAESVALGIPIISSGKGALKEVVTGNIITMEEHTANALVKAIKKAMKNGWKQKTSRKYEMIEMIECYIELYSSVK